MSLPLEFTPAEAELLGRTADALCAWMGKPVLAEIVLEAEEGYEWALFALPLGPKDDAQDKPRVQVGGPQARFLGNCGGLDLSDGEPVDCEFLWAIQLSDLEGVRYIKVDASGEEAGWSDALADLLPFQLSEAAPLRPPRDDKNHKNDAEEEEEEEEEDDDLDEDDFDDEDLDDDDFEDEDEDEDDEADDEENGNDVPDDAEPDLGRESDRR